MYPVSSVRWPRREAYNTPTTGVEVQYYSCKFAAALCLAGCIETVWLHGVWQSVGQDPCEGQNCEGSLSALTFLAVDVTSG
jgi:hypothetical protein